MVTFDSRVADARRPDLPELPPLREQPWRVSVFYVRRPDFRAAADEAGDDRVSLTEIKTYWVQDIVRVAFNCEALQAQAELAGWDVTFGPIGLSWSWVASRAAYRDGGGR